METLDLRAARRLALARAGLLKPDWTGLPRRAAGSGKRARDAANAIIRRFGYLQLDTVSVAGARSHCIVLLSRLEGIAPELGEKLLAPGEPLFEYWGHEASWLPLEYYPAFAFRREAYRDHPWWGDLIGQHPQVTQTLRQRLRDEGPLRSSDIEGGGNRGWWELKTAKKIASALWSRGEIAIRERRAFQRTYDLAERVIPAELREAPMAKEDALELLLARALAGHGWASTGTLAQTWRLRNMQQDVAQALDRLEAQGLARRCQLIDGDGNARVGWVRPQDLELSERLARVRPAPDRGVLLSPFDPLLWDRGRVKLLFAFDQVLEIFKPAPTRVYGYYCLPVLAGDRLVARVDLKADRRTESLSVLSCHYEAVDPKGKVPAADREATRVALQRYAGALRLEVR